MGISWVNVDLTAGVAAGSQCQFLAGEAYGIPLTQEFARA